MLAARTAVGAVAGAKPVRTGLADPAESVQQAMLAAAALAAAPQRPPVLARAALGAPRPELSVRAALALGAVSAEVSVRAGAALGAGEWQPSVGARPALQAARPRPAVAAAAADAAVVAEPAVGAGATLGTAARRPAVGAGPALWTPLHEAAVLAAAAADAVSQAVRAEAGTSLRPWEFPSPDPCQAGVAELPPGLCGGARRRRQRRPVRGSAVGADQEPLRPAPRAAQQWAALQADAALPRPRPPPLRPAPSSFQPLGPAGVGPGPGVAAGALGRAPPAPARLQLPGAVHELRLGPGRGGGGGREGAAEARDPGEVVAQVVAQCRQAQIVRPLAGRAELRPLPARRIAAGGAPCAGCAEASAERSFWPPPLRGGPLRRRRG
mmetsp:Transcript_56690/g.123452  ORF Transcript_56690/g.123452 Transcript_56690/m.123452 type:complete len:382 (-) Transcript_56690:228-1373(-)